MIDEAIKEIRDNPDDYHDKAEYWVVNNPHILMAFFEDADRLRVQGRTRYSARKIVQEIRWDTNLKERDGNYKVANFITPSLSRLYMKIKNAEGFFRTADMDKKRYSGVDWRRGAMPEGVLVVVKFENGEYGLRTRKDEEMWDEDEFIDDSGYVVHAWADIGAG